MTASPHPPEAVDRVPVSRKRGYLASLVGGVAGAVLSAIVMVPVAFEPLLTLFAPLLLPVVPLTARALANLATTDREGTA